jgi:hypothetical protein
VGPRTERIGYARPNALPDAPTPLPRFLRPLFLVVDLAISATGLTALRRAKRGLNWRSLALVSLALTSCSGLMAVSFWALRADFDPAWWLPNLFLLLYPLWFLATLVRDSRP